MLKKILTFGRTTCPTCNHVAKYLGMVDSYRGYYYYCNKKDCPERFHEFKCTNNGDIHYINSYVYRRVGMYSYLMKNVDGSIEERRYS